MSISTFFSAYILQAVCTSSRAPHHSASHAVAWRRRRGREGGGAIDSARQPKAIMQKGLLDAQPIDKTRETSEERSQREVSERGENEKIRVM